MCSLGLKSCHCILKEVIFQGPTVTPAACGGWWEFLGGPGCVISLLLWVCSTEGLYCPLTGVAAPLPSHCLVNLHLVWPRQCLLAALFSLNPDNRGEGTE